MPVAQRRGDPGKADLLFSRIVRARGICERCGDQAGPHQTAHVIGRRYSAVRCEETNAWCLCVSCHLVVDQWADEKMALVERTIGRERYEENRRLAETFSTTRPSSVMFWRNELARLLERCAELGVDTRRRVA